MTLKELWELFPIVLTPHQTQWEEWAKAEIQTLSTALADFSPVINHIGSTAVPAIWAKPIIDLLIETAPDSEWTRVRTILESCGYLLMSASDSRMSFNKGYTPEGFAEKVFHVHVRTMGDRDEVYFRDYLRSHPDCAYEYEQLKRSLLPEYKHDRDGYTAAKAGFVGSVTRLAKAERKKA